jgi:hypothetical protein
MTGGTPPFAPVPATAKPDAAPKALPAPAAPVWVIGDDARCESCIQRAYARIYMTPESYFELCRHHYLRHKDAILAVAWDVIDETARLENQKVDVSA